MYRLIYKRDNITQELNDLISADLIEKANSAPVCTITMHKLTVDSIDQYATSNAAVMNATLTVYDEKNKIQFRGRMLSNEIDTDGFIEFVFESDLGRLNDAIMAPYTYAGSVGGFFGNILTAYNSTLNNPSMQFHRDTVDVVDVGETTEAQQRITRSSVDYDSCWNVLKDKLVDMLGGYITLRYDQNDNDKMYLGYRAFNIIDSSATATQTIEFGKNIIDISKKRNGENVVTNIIPLGAKDEDTGKRLTIASVNSGSDKLVLEEAYQWGNIQKLLTFDDVHDASILKKKAQKYINQLQSIDFVEKTVNTNAVDLGYVDNSIQRFKLYDVVHVISSIHQIDDYLLITERKRNLLEPSKDTINLGSQEARFTSMGGRNASVQVIQGGGAVIDLSNYYTKQEVDAKYSDLEFPISIMEYQFISPEWFGAKGDGITDDTEAVQMCFNLVSGNDRNVLFIGSYKITSPIVFNGSNLIIDFNGRSLIYTGTDYAIKINELNNARLSYIIIKNGSIDTNGGGIQVIDSSNVTIEKMVISHKGTTSNSIHFVNGWNNKVCDSHLLGKTGEKVGNGIKYDISTTSVSGVMNVTNTEFDNVLIQRFGTGIKFAGIAGGSFDSTMIKNIGISGSGIGMDFYKNINNVSIDTCRTESSTTAVKCDGDTCLTVNDYTCINTDFIINNGGTVVLAGYVQLNANSAAADNYVVHTNSGLIQVNGPVKKLGSHAKDINSCTGKILSNYKEFTGEISSLDSISPFKFQTVENGSGVLNLNNLDVPVGFEMFTYRKSGKSGWNLPDGTTSNYTTADYIYHFRKLSSGWAWTKSAK